MTNTKAGGKGTGGTRLSDLALVLLSHAANRDGSMVLPMPASIKARGAALQKVLTSLLSKGLLEEAEASAPEQAWRTGEDGSRIGLLISAAGLSAIGVAPAIGNGDDPKEGDEAAQDCASGEGEGAAAGLAEEPSVVTMEGQETHLAAPVVEGAGAADPSRAATEPTAASRGAIRPGSKQALLVGELTQEEGATIAHLVTMLGWQAHTVRAALTGLRRKGFAITRERSGAGETVYRATLPGPGKSDPAPTGMEPQSDAAAT